MVVAVLVCWPAGSFGQGTSIALTDKITSLDGVWIHDPTRGYHDTCDPPGGRGATNIHRDVYVVDRDELTIWRNFTIEWPDGSLSSTACSYRQALVYRRLREAR